MVIGVEMIKYDEREHRNRETNGHVMFMGVDRLADGDESKHGR